MSSRIPFRRRGPRALPRERKKDAGKEAAGALPQAGQGRARRHTERPGQGQVVQADGPRPGPLALDGGRRGGPQPHRVQGARQGREGPGRAGGRVPQAAVVAALLQRVQEPALPQLLEEVALRVLGGQGAGARRRRAARVQDRRRPGRGGVRAHNGPDQVRRRAGAVAPADSAGQGRPDRGLALDHIPVDIARLRRDVRPRPAQEVRLQAQVALGAAEADGSTAGRAPSPPSWGCPRRGAPPPARWTP